MGHHSLLGIRGTLIANVVTIPRAHDGFLSVMVIKFPILSCRT
jgi:hypothetical protein